MDGWREGGCKVKSSMASKVFCLTMLSFGPPSCALVDYHLERGGMPLHHAVHAVKCLNGANTEDQGAGAWYMG